MIKEYELNDVAKIFLTDIGATELHGEVSNIDLVGKTHKNTLIGLELKTRLTVTVLKQAFERINRVNYIYVGIPYKRRGPIHFKTLNPVYKHFMEYHGIGLVILHPKQTRNSTTKVFYHYEILKHAKLNRSPKWKAETLKSLNEFTLNKDGGFRSGDTITPFMKVLEEVENVLRVLTMSHHHKRRWVHINEIKELCRLAKKHYKNLHSGIYKILNMSSWAKKHPTERSYYIYVEKECN